MPERGRYFLIFWIILDNPLRGIFHSMINNNFKRQGKVYAMDSMSREGREFLVIDFRLDGSLRF